nr:xylulose kinase-1 [Tanacetum cinerariifolium]
MSTPTFAETHNLVAFLEKPAESAGFEKIIDFLKSIPIHYALTMNPTIYVSCVKQFWATTKVLKVNDQEEIQALVDKTKVIITEDNIRSDLHLDDAERTVCLLNETWVIYQLKPIKHSLLINHPISKPQKPQKPKRKHRKEAETSHDESKDEDHVSTPSSDILPSSEDSFILNELMVFCTSLQEQVFDLQEANDAQEKEIVSLKKKITKLTKWRKSKSGGLRRLKRIGSGRRVKSLMEKDGLGAQEDASKQERVIEEIDQNAEIALDIETQRRTNDDEMFGDDDLAGEEVVMDSVAEPVTTVKDSAAPTTDVTEDEITMAQALAALKSLKPKVVVQEQEMSTTIPAAATKVTTAVPTPRAKGIVFHEQKQSQIPTVSLSKDKGKVKMIEPEVP